MKPYIYLRALRHAEHTVFCVQDGQKTYWDNEFNTRVPFSSGQQVKRSVLEEILANLGQKMAPTTFNFEISKDDKIGSKEVWSPCNPEYVDQLLGGWMKAGSTKKKQNDSDNKDDGLGVLKRRSPLSFSAMRPLHPLLATAYTENLTFDRSNCPMEESAEYPAIIVRRDGKKLNNDEISKFLSENDRTISKRTWIPEVLRTSGLFVYDIAIDLRRLFCVSIDTYEPEISDAIKNKLKSQKWEERENVFGKCLVMPKDKRDKVIPELAKAMIDWRITSNQARTFSPMETLAVAISDNANNITGAIRAKLEYSSDDKLKAIPILDQSAGADLFVTLPCAGYIVTEIESKDALAKAKAKLEDVLMKFDYDNQVGK